MIGRNYVQVVQLCFPEFVFPPLMTTNCALLSHCYPGTIPPDIGSLVKLTELKFNSAANAGATSRRSGKCERLCGHTSRRVIASRLISFQKRLTHTLP